MATRAGGDDAQSQESHPLAEGRPCAAPGEVLADRYRVVELLGRGGMGEVYLATHVAIGRQVAVKILRGDIQESPDMARRFLQEARTASLLRHPNIVDIIDFGYSERGAPFFVMELLEGEDLKALVKRERTLPWPRICAITTEICAALTVAHGHGIVHRDMKPDNVFLIRHGEVEHVKVLDFGIAKVLAGQAVGEGTRTGVLLGTPHYMSPEQAGEDALDGRSDVYSMGVLLYRMCAGRLPFRGPSFIKVLGQQMHDAPPPPSEFAPPGTLTPEAEAIILKCLAKRPEDRYPSAEALAAALRASLKAAAVHSETPSAAATASVSEVHAGASSTVTTTSVARSGWLRQGGWIVLGAAVLASGVLALSWLGGERGSTSADAAEAVGVTMPGDGEAAEGGGVVVAEVVAAADQGEVKADAMAPAAEGGGVVAEVVAPAAEGGEAMAEVVAPAAEGGEAAAPEPGVGKREKPKKAVPGPAKPAPKQSLSSEDLSAAAASVRGGLSRCAGGLPGMVIKVELTVSAAGKVTSAQAQKPQRGSALGRCVEEVASTARFPARLGAETVTISLRLP